MQRHIRTRVEDMTGNDLVEYVFSFVAFCNRFWVYYYRAPTDFPKTLDFLVAQTTWMARAVFAMSR